MAIKTTQHCDRCQIEIQPEPGRQGFPQLSWCFFRKGFRLLKDNVGAPVLRSDWQGKVNRLEFCQDHGQDLNVLLKGFVGQDARVMSLVATLRSEDDSDWTKKQGDLQAEFDKLSANFKASQVKGASPR